jgi:arylsulfatase A-like enzyme
MQNLQNHSPLLLRMLTVLGTIAALAGPLSGPLSGATDQPNVLLIVADDLGAADLGVLGSSDLRTPNLDQLYADSLRLNQCYANSPVCSPTRAALMTGCYPDRVGVPGVIRTDENNSWGYFLPFDKTLPSVLQDQGYETHAVGKWHLGLREENHPLSHGFQSFQGFLGDMMDDYNTHRRHGNNYMREDRAEIKPTGHATDLFSDWAVDFINNKANKRYPKPWFLYLAYNAPHAPIQPPPAWLQQVQKRERGIDSKRAALVALIEHMDAGIGRVLTALRESDQDQRTVIVFTSDNGGQIDLGANNGRLRDGKGSMYEGGLRIPACIRVPASPAAGQATDALCSTIDLLPTLAELAGGVAPVGIDGVSLGPLLTNPNRLWPARDVYFVRREGGVQFGGLTSQAVRKGRFKLVHNLPIQGFELFDLVEDPLETTNLLTRNPQQAHELLSLLQRHTQRGGQAAWQKPVPEFWPVPNRR